MPQDPAVARGWVAEINSIISGMSHARPSRVLALINPKGWSRKASKVWAKKAHPILQLAGAHCCPRRHLCRLLTTNKGKTGCQCPCLRVQASNAWQCTPSMLIMLTNWLPTSPSKTWKAMTGSWQ